MELEEEPYFFDDDAQVVDWYNEHQTDYEYPSSVTLKITLPIQIQSIIFPLLITGFLAAIAVLMVIDASKIDFKFFIFGGGFFVFLAVMTLPAFFLHAEYLEKNKNEEYKIENKKIIRRKNGVEEFYSADEIDNIYLCFTNSKFNTTGRSRYGLVWHNYHYAKIVMKSGEELYLTSLLYPADIEEVLDRYLKMPYWRLRQWYPSTHSTILNDDDKVWNDDL